MLPGAIASDDAAHGLDLAVGDVQILDLEQERRSCHAAQIGFAAPRGSLRTSAGMPSASLVPKSITTRRSVRPITNSMSCSTSRMVMPSSRKRAQQVGQRLLLVEAQAGGRLVEQQQRRVGGERAGDLERCAAGRAAGCRRGRQATAAEPDALELARAPRRRARASSRAVEPQRAARASRRGRADSAPSATFSITDMLGTQLHVLEGAGDAGRAIAARPAPVIVSPRNDDRAVVAAERRR